MRRLVYAIVGLEILIIFYQPLFYAVGDNWKFNRGWWATVFGKSDTVVIPIKLAYFFEFLFVCALAITSSLVCVYTVECIQEFQTFIKPHWKDIKEFVKTLQPTPSQTKLLQQHLGLWFEPRNYSVDFKHLNDTITTFITKESQTCTALAMVSTSGISKWDFTHSPQLEFHQTGDIGQQFISFDEAYFESYIRFHFPITQSKPDYAHQLAFSLLFWSRAAKLARKIGIQRLFWECPFDFCPTVIAPSTQIEHILLNYLLETPQSLRLRLKLNSSKFASCTFVFSRTSLSQQPSCEIDENHHALIKVYLTSTDTTPPIIFENILNCI